MNEKTKNRVTSIKFNDKSLKYEVHWYGLNPQSFTILILEQQKHCNF